MEKTRTYQLIQRKQEKVNLIPYHLPITYGETSQDKTTAAGCNSFVQPRIYLLFQHFCWRKTTSLSFCIPWRSTPLVCVIAICWSSGQRMSHYHPHILTNQRPILNHVVSSEITTWYWNFPTDWPAPRSSHWSPGMVPLSFNFIYRVNYISLDVDLRNIF